MKYFLLLFVFFTTVLSVEAQSLPEFEIKNVKNAKVTRDSILIANKVTVVNFWANWCAPCKEEMMEIKKIQSLPEFKDIQFISISIDKKEDIENAKSWFFKNNKSTWRLYFDSEKSLFKQILTLTNNSSSSIPVCLVINYNGELVSFHQGFDQQKYKDELLEDIKSINR